VLPCTHEWNETKRNEMKLSRNRAQSHYDCPAVGPWVLVSFCLESDKCLEPLELSALHRRKKLYSWPQVQVRAGQNEQDNTVFGGHSKPVPMSEVKTQKTKAEAKGKWKISNQRRPVELQLEGQSRKPDEALELFCNRWVPSEDIIWLDNTTRPFFQGTAGFYGSLPDYPTFWPPAKPHCKAS